MWLPLLLNSVSSGARFGYLAVAPVASKYPEKEYSMDVWLSGATVCRQRARHPCTNRIVQKGGSTNSLHVAMRYSTHDSAQLSNLDTCL